jgi:hypothetical protein
MTIIAVFVILALFALASLLWLVRAAFTSHPASALRAVDLDAFRNLTDPAEEEFLRVQLPPREFRRIQRERLHAALDYVGCLAGNSVVLLHAGQSARQNADPQVAELGARLVENAVQLRVQSFQAMVKLSIGMAFPGLRISAGRIAERYELTVHQRTTLGYMQRSAARAAA